MARSRVPRPLPIPPSTPSPYEPSSGKLPHPPNANPSIPHSPITVQMHTCTSDNKELQNTDRSQDDTTQAYLKSSSIHYNTTDANPNHPRSRHSSFSTVSLCTTPEPQPRSQSTSTFEQVQRGVSRKCHPSMSGLQGKHTSQPKKTSGVKIAYNKDEEPIPTSGLLWYRGPVHGALPGRTLRSHSTTKIRNKAWVIGGYDDRQTYHDIYCLDLGMTSLLFSTTNTQFYFRNPAVVASGVQRRCSSPCRGHTATAVDHRIFVIGGTSANATSEPITVYIFDTLALSWMQPRIAPGSSPVQRRAHSAVYWDEKIWIFGGGNGFTALNDVWSLDVSSVIEGRRTMYGRVDSPLLRWEHLEQQEVEPAAKRRNWPNARGYHTADVVDNFMIIIGGGDGQSCLDSIWVLNFETKEWYHVDWLKGSPLASRLAHSSTRLGPYLVVFGGVASQEYDSELYLLNLVTLKQERRRVYGIPPTPRGYHTVVQGNGRIHVIGGANATHGFDDVYILELASLAYFPQITDFKVEPLEDIGWYREL